MRRSKILSTLFLLTASAGALAGQETPAAPTLQELSAQLTAQAELIEQLRSELERQGKLLESQTSELDTQRTALQSLRTTTDQIAQSHGQAQPRSEMERSVIERLESLEATVSEQPEQPTNILTAGDFPGSIRLPGTNMAFKPGGFVRLSAVNSFDPIGSDDRFIVGSIPTEGDAEATEEPRATISAARSKLNMDIRMDSSVGQFRAFLEGDFAGEGGTDNYRLRHAFGQYNQLLVGQTWSTFMDTAAIPEELDFEGLSAQINARHPLVRWAGLKLVGQNWGFALENPESSFTGGDGVGVFPDIALNTSWNRERRHLQLGLLLRTLGGTPLLEAGAQGAEDTAFAYGLNLSGSVVVGRRNDFDNFKFQLNGGRGIGNYINDLRSVGGQDGTFDPQGNLDALPVFAGYVAYQRLWRPIPRTTFFRSLRSTLVYSYVWVDNYAYQLGGAYNVTQRASANLMFSPISKLDLGFEVIWGERRNKDNSVGQALQAQMVATFTF
jgi:hypothetical protein